jgi:hypothetical protein
MNDRIGPKGKFFRRAGWTIPPTKRSFESENGAWGMGIVRVGLQFLGMTRWVSAEDGRPTGQRRRLSHFPRCVELVSKPPASAWGVSKADGRFVYHAGRLATSSQKTHWDGFLYSSGQPVEEDHRLCEGFDDGAKSRLAA